MNDDELAKKIRALEEYMRRLESEKVDWDAIMSSDHAKLARLSEKRAARALAVTQRQAQERRAKEWEAFAKGGPCPPLSDAEIDRLMRDLFGPGWVPPHERGAK